MKLFNQIICILAIISPILASILGIDFGQQFTKSALLGPGVNFEILLTVDSKRKDISGLAMAIAPNSNNEIQRSFGSSSLSTCVKNPQACFTSFKSLLGKAIDDESTTQLYLNSHPGIELAPANYSRNTIDFKYNHDSYPVEEILAMYFRDIKSRADDYLGDHASPGYTKVQKTAITVPGFFNQAQRRAILDAAEIAGLDVVSLVDDGIAIAAEYASSRAFEIEKEYHLIYDMGAGSTKATLVSFSQNNSDISIVNEGYGFDETLGGELLTNSIKELLISKFLAANPKVKISDFLSNSRAITRLLQSAEKAKSVLSANTETRVSIENIYNEIDFKTTITRAEYEEINSPIMERITAPILKAIQSNSERRDSEDEDQPEITLKDIKSVILAGGSTRVPFVQRHLISLVGEDVISKNVNADEAAVLGTTLRGVQISGLFRSKRMTVVESTTNDFCYKIVSNELDEKDSNLVTVFPVNAKINSKKSVKLNQLKDTFSDFELDFYSNGEFISQANISPSEKFDNKLCTNGTSYIARLELDNSGLASLTSVDQFCYFEKITKLANNSTETDETDKTSSKTSEEEAATTSIASKKEKLEPKIKYPYIRPMGVSTKKICKNRISKLDTKDAVRIEKATTVNKLEAILYSLRSHLDEDEIAEFVNSKSTFIDDISTFVKENLEWLEETYQLPDLEVIQSKLEAATKKVSDIKEFTRVHKSLRDSEFYKNMTTISNEAMFGIQDFLLTMSEDLTSIHTNYTMAGVDINEANKKIEVMTNPFDEATIKEHFDALGELLDKIKTLTEDEDVLAEKSIDYLFQLFKDVVKELEVLTKIKNVLVRIHTKRITKLQEYLVKQLKKKLKAERKSKSKASSKSAKSEEEATTTSIAPENTDSSNASDSSSDSSTVQKDEL
ncbi:binding protein [[Candida] boidinii]|nr:binding protein [[Candida] boidinii]